MPPIIPRTVTKPSVQTVESTIKAPLQGKRRYLRKKLTSQRLEPKATYIKPPTLPTEGTKI